MTAWTLAAVLSAALIGAPPQAAAATSPQASERAEKASGSGFSLDPDSWVGDEDLLMVFQSVAALGAASLVGGLALLPGYGMFFFVVIISLASQSPGLLVAGPSAVLAATIVAQAISAGVTVWIISRASEGFAARTYVPPLVRDVIKQRAGVDAGKGWWGVVLGAPWLSGFAGYMVGAVLGLAAGVAIAGPLIAAGVVLAQQPAETNPAGIFALLGALMVGLTVIAAAETLVAPPMAALAHHMTKVALEEAAAP